MKKKISYKIRSDEIIFYIESPSASKIMIDAVDISNASNEISHRLDFNECFDPIIAIDGEPAELDFPLFSSKKDNSVFRKERHPDPESQAFIAYQNARFSSDTAFKAASLVVLMYRAIECEMCQYDSFINNKINELFSSCKELPDDNSVRKNSFQLQISLLYTGLMFHLYKGNIEDCLQFRTRFYELIVNFNFDCYLAPSVYNIIKFHSLVELFFNQKSSNANNLSVIENYFRESLHRISLNSSINHIDEFRRSFEDYQNLVALKKIHSGEISSFRGKSKDAMAVVVLNNAIRVDSAPAIKKITKTLNKLNDGKLEQ